MDDQISISYSLDTTGAIKRTLATIIGEVRRQFWIDADKSNAVWKFTNPLYLEILKMPITAEDERLGIEINTYAGIPIEQVESDNVLGWLEARNNHFTVIVFILNWNMDVLVKFVSVAPTTPDPMQEWMDYHHG